MRNPRAISMSSGVMAVCNTQGSGASGERVGAPHDASTEQATPPPAVPPPCSPALADTLSHSHTHALRHSLTTMPRPHSLARSLTHTRTLIVAFCKPVYLYTGRHRKSISYHTRNCAQQQRLLVLLLVVLLLVVLHLVGLLDVVLLVVVVVVLVLHPWLFMTTPLLLCSTFFLSLLLATPR